MYMQSSIRPVAAWWQAGCLALLLLLAASDCAALGVTQPTASTVVVAGDDYATQVLGNAWDMNASATKADEDIATDESGNVTNQTFSGGLFSASTTTGDNNVFPLFMGYSGSINSSRGYAHPVDTAHYRNFTVKFRATRPTPNTEVAYVSFYQSDTSSYNNGTYGETNFLAVPASQFIIYTFDLVANNDNLHHHWTDFPTVQGIRFNPALDNNSPFASVQFDIDWMRLTPAAAAGDKTNVQWTDSGYSGTYTISANETSTNAASVVLASGVSGTNYAADLTILPPGQYTVTVTRDVGGTAASSAAFRINSPPQVALTAPDVHGDQTRNFAATVVGNPWGPIDAGDFILINNFSNIVYNNPAGTFYGRPTNADPQWFMNLANQAIDTSLYRSFCFTMKDFGQRSIGLGSVARFFWGQKTTGNLTISQDIPLFSGGPNEYCFADVAAIPVEAQSLGGPWTGTQTEFRLDPIEFSVSAACTSTPSPANCHDIDLVSAVLSPFAQANPGYTFKWNLADADDANVALSLYLDRDTTFGNSNELLIYNANVPSSNGQFVWSGSTSVNYGTYHAYIVADDGRNRVGQYSTGPIIVGARDGIFRNGFDAVP